MTYVSVGWKRISNRSSHHCWNNSSSRFIDFGCREEGQEEKKERSNINRHCRRRGNYSKADEKKEEKNIIINCDSK